MNIISQSDKTSLTLAGWVALVLKLLARDFGKKTEGNEILCWRREGSLGTESNMVRTVNVISCVCKRIRSREYPTPALGLL